MSGKYSVRVEGRFESAHFLRSYNGEPEPLHGHSYKVEAELSAASSGVDHEAIAVDFIAAERALRTLAARLDYKCINDVEPFTTLSPSAENIARWFSDELSSQLGGGARVDSITVWEGPFHAATYKG
jgi:6-pyruvoyltetrahydropterin/6-carboxytetrahydropterin synthase